MVFSSLPPYLDPSNWHPTNTPQPQPQPQPHGGGPGGSGSIRPGSMSERARQANIPMPESALKCPRCDSTNTKFCYFNNYSLSQPRHFCKTCRRYWTRGGALRTVPVGGGCRRNTKRSSSTSKSSSSKSSPATSTDKPAAPYSGGLFQPLSFAGDIIQPTSDALLHHSMMGGAGFHGGACSSNFLGFEQWKNMQQFPFLGGLDPPAPGPQLFSGDLGFLGGGDQFRPKMSSSFLSQLASVKMEESKNNNTTHADLSNLVSRELMLGNDDQWINMNGASGGGNWTELSGFSSSTSNHLQ